jgi:hypothetical protein
MRFAAGGRSMQDGFLLSVSTLRAASRFSRCGVLFATGHNVNQTASLS